MVKKIGNINDFIVTVTEFNAIKQELSAGKQGSAALIERLLSFSEPIMGFDNKAVSDQVASYSVTAVRLVDELKKGDVKERSISEWCEAVKRSITMFFLLLSGDKRYELVGEDEDDSLLTDFFRDGDFYEKAAYYLAVRRLARKKPEYCYDETMEIFTMYPDLVSRLYNEISYTYDPENAKDEYFEVCPICGSKESEPYYCADQALAATSQFAPAKLWMKCGGCHNMYAYNFPVQLMGDINGHYTKGSSGNLLTPRQILWTYSEIFNHARELNDGRRYLEIGVGTGEMLAVALEMGYDVSAVEICREDCENISGALGVDVVWSDFMRYETDKKFDLIIMGDVLEHVSSPIEALKKAYGMLGEKGVLWLSTPNYESGFTRMRKFSDPMWNQKNHFTYFSFDGLKPFLDEIGLEVKRYDASNRYNGSMELYLQKK